MSMFDDLDPDFPIVKPADAAATVATRAHQIRTHRQLLIAGAALALVAIVLAVSIAFASPGSKPNHVVIAAPTTTSTATLGTDNARTRTTTTTEPSTTPSPSTTLPRRHHGGGGNGGGGGGGNNPTTTTTTPQHSQFDWSMVVETPTPSSLDMKQGDSKTVTVKVTNTGSWTVALAPACNAPLYLNLDFAGGTDRRCEGQAADTLAAGASFTRSFSIVAVIDHVGAPITHASDPGDYSYTIPYVHGVPIKVHVTSAVTYSLDPDTVTARAGTIVTVNLEVTSSTPYFVDVDQLPDRCTQIPPAPEVVCGSLDNFQTLGGHNLSLSDTVGMNTSGLPPGTYQVSVGPKTLTLTLT